MIPLAAQKLDLPANLSIHRASTRLDPTRTLTLRNRFEVQMKRRFADLKRAIRRVVVDEDSFNLNPVPGQVGRLIVQANFDFPTSEGKKNTFMAWLKQQEEQGILETMHLPRIGQAIEPAWTDTFIKDSYQRGVQRARYELVGSGYPVPTLAETGGLVASMSTPFHIDRLGAAYSRAFDQLKGITADMDAKISHILAQGLADGDNPLLLARKMLAVIDGTGAGTLGITDSLGRFIPAERRARMLARTEVVRAHHLAMIQEYENWAVEGVKVVAEWVTAGFKVCPQCQELARSGPYTLEKIKYMLPAHPFCRCVAVPEPVEEKGRGRAAGPAEEVTLPENFIPATNLTKLEQKFEDVTGIKKIENVTSGIMFGEEYTEIESLHIGNQTLEHFDYLFKEYPKSKDTSAPLRGLWMGKKVYLDEEGVMGRYYKNDRIIDIGAEQLKDHVLTIGKFEVGKDYFSTLRHEYGHFFYARGTTPDQINEWIRIYHLKTQLDWSYLVSIYGATNEAELFAESFSAYTSPLYKRGMIPHIVERFFDKVLGRR